jgi:hypothetical protein
MERDNQRREYEMQRKKEAERSQVLSGIPHSGEIAASPAPSPIPQSPIPQAWTESPASTFYSSSPTSGIGSASTAVSPEIPSEAQMQRKGERTNSWGKKLMTSVFKRKDKDDMQRKLRVCNQFPASELFLAMHMQETWLIFANALWIRA